MTLILIESRPRSLTWQIKRNSDSNGETVAETKTSLMTRIHRPKKVKEGSERNLDAVMKVVMIDNAPTQTSFRGLTLSAAVRCAMIHLRMFKRIAEEKKRRKNERAVQRVNLNSSRSHCRVLLEHQRLPTLELRELERVTLNLRETLI